MTRAIYSFPVKNWYFNACLRDLSDGNMVTITFRQPGIDLGKQENGTRDYLLKNVTKHYDIDQKIT
jgi:hypothetical protein